MCGGDWGPSEPTGWETQTSFSRHICLPRLCLDIDAGSARYEGVPCLQEEKSMSWSAVDVPQWPPLPTSPKPLERMHLWAPAFSLPDLWTRLPHLSCIILSKESRNSMDSPHEEKSLASSGATSDRRRRPWEYKSIHFKNRLQPFCATPTIASAARANLGKNEKISKSPTTTSTLQLRTMRLFYSFKKMMLDHKLSSTTPAHCFSSYVILRWCADTSPSKVRSLESTGTHAICLPESSREYLGTGVVLGVVWR